MMRNTVETSQRLRMEVSTLEYLSFIFVCSLSTQVFADYSFSLASSSAPQTSLGGV